MCLYDKARKIVAAFWTGSECAARSDDVWADGAMRSLDGGVTFAILYAYTCFEVYMMDSNKFSKAKRCACGNIRRATRSITQYYDEYLKASGLRATQFSVLTSISLNDGITIGELADLLVMDQTTVTRNLTMLKREGYVHLASEKSDARKKHLRLTPKGFEKLTEAMPLWEIAQNRLEIGMGQERFREMISIFSQLITLTK